MEARALVEIVGSCIQAGVAVCQRQQIKQMCTQSLRSGSSVALPLADLTERALDAVQLESQQFGQQLVLSRLS